MINEIKEDDLKHYVKNGYLTKGKLKEWLLKNDDIPDESPILIQRVEDRYYEGVDISGMMGFRDENGELKPYPEGSKSTGWGAYLKKGEHYHQVLWFNEEMRKEIERRKNNEESQYPKIENPNDHIFELEPEYYTQYHPAWCCVRYNDDNKVFIDLHY